MKPIIIVIGATLAITGVLYHEPHPVAVTLAEASLETAPQDR